MCNLLKKSLEIIEKYNDMDFDKFVILLREKKIIDISDQKINDFRYMGLSNVDFYKVYRI
jgi:hypothetical protein